LCGLFKLKNLKTEEDLEVVQALLKRAEKYFREDRNEWGLGLTYSLMGRSCTLKELSTELSESTYQTAKFYLRKAIENFAKCEHYRGIYMSYEDLIELQQQYIYDFKIPDADKLTKIDRANASYLKIYQEFKLKFRQ